MEKDKLTPSYVTIINSAYIGNAIIKTFTMYILEHKWGGAHRARGEAISPKYSFIFSVQKG